MQYKKKRDNKKPLSVALGVILALSPCAVISYNLALVPVHADAGDFSGISDYITSNVASFASSAGGAEYISSLWAIKTCLDNPVSSTGFDFASCTIIGGFFYDDSGNLHSGSSIQRKNVNNIDGGTPIFNSSLFSVNMVFPSDTVFRCDSTISSNSTTFTFGAYYNNGYFASSTLYTISGYLNNLQTGGSPAYVVCLTDSSPTPTIPRSASPTAKSNRIVLGGKTIPPNTLPSWDGVSDYTVYINQSLNPYFVEKYPDLEPYIFTPYSPEYEDPSDFYPGVPKDWTIKNPQLPTSPSIGLNAYKPDLSEMNPSESIMEYDTGFDFWWWLTNQVLTHTNTKVIVLLAILLGLVGYLLWHLGGHL